MFYVTNIKYRFDVTNKALLLNTQFDEKCLLSAISLCMIDATSMLQLSYQPILLYMPAFYRSKFKICLPHFVHIMMLIGCIYCMLVSPECFRNAVNFVRQAVMYVLMLPLFADNNACCIATPNLPYT